MFTNAQKPMEEKESKSGSRILFFVLKCLRKQDKNSAKHLSLKQMQLYEI